MTKHPSNWLTIKPEGLYCIPGKFYIDPYFPVDHALITHGHSDHARFGHEHVLATQETLAIMNARFDMTQTKQQTTAYHKNILLNQVLVSFLPAGHIIGSAQILLQYQNQRCIFSGDYKRQDDPTCLPFAVTHCDVFITESTFAMPVFTHPPIHEELQKLFDSLKRFPERCHLIAAYTLGKCQRILLALRALGYDRPIYFHGAMRKFCDLYQSFGFDFGELILVSPENASHLQGEIVFCPPYCLHDRWTRRLPNPLPIFASGWMQIRARAKQKGVELPLVISDHADWPALTQTIHEVNAPEIWITHGLDEALQYYATMHGFSARAVNLLHDIQDED